MFNRIKRIYDLSRKDPEALKTLESLTPEQLAEVPEAGDGKAEFFGEPTKEDFKEYEREQEGTKSWYERLKNL